MTHPADPSVPAPDNTARTHSQLRLMKALLELDDPEVERALTVIVERLVVAARDDGEDGGDRASAPRNRR
jgi:hypothetical protein